MIKALQGLAESDLKDISKALLSGRLYPPFTAAALQRYCSAQNAADVALEMQSLYDEELKLKHLALMLDMLAENRSLQSKPEDVVELVWTGPEAPNMSNRDTSVVVRELFSGARERVLLAGYAIYQGVSVFRSLAEQMEQIPELEVKMFLNVQRQHGDTTKNSEILHQFAHRFKTHEWPGSRMPEIYYDPRSLATDTKKANLHAKCIVIDRKLAFVSSANFTEAAQIRNIEAGVLIRSERFATLLSHHFEALISAGMLLSLPGA